jgi:Na+/glutamate symporter
MELTQIITVVTIILTWILGIFAKKSKFISNNLIPIQNILIGVIVAIIEWIITKDFKVAIALSGLLAGGAYDVLNNINKMIKKEG